MYINIYSFFIVFGLNNRYFVIRHSRGNGIRTILLFVQFSKTLVRNRNGEQARGRHSRSATTLAAHDRTHRSRTLRQTELWWRATPSSFISQVAPAAAAARPAPPLPPPKPYAHLRRYLSILRAIVFLILAGP